MKPHLRSGYSHEIQTINEDGELLDVEIKTNKYLVDTKEEFVQIYTSIQAKLEGLGYTAEKVLFYCIFNCDSSNVINLSSFHKKKIEKQFEFAPSTVANAITTLSQRQLLIRIDRATYRVNPIHAWKGNSVDRKKTIKYVLEIECPEC